ncbi:MAG: Hsp20/alpha crystallin family protein [Rhodospirillaceae bacterium]
MIHEAFADRTEVADFPPTTLNHSAASDVRVIAGKDHYELMINLAGADEDDIIVGVIDHVLTVAAKTISEACGDIGSFLVVDHRESTIEQSFSLPFDANEQDMAMQFEAGILTVTIGRLTAAKPVDLSMWRSVHAHS